MNAYDVAMAVINAFCGGACTWPVSQLSNASPQQMTNYGHKLVGVSDVVEQRSAGVVTASCMTGTGRPMYQGQAQVQMNTSYNQMTDAMGQIREGLQGIAGKVQEVGKFIEKAQKYLKELLEKFRLKIIKLLGSWWGMLVVTAVAFLAVKLIKALVNKVAGKMGAAGAIIRTAGDKLANDIQTTLTKKPVELPDVKAPQKITVPTSTTPPGGDIQLRPIVDNNPPPPPPPTWVAKPVQTGANAKPMPNVIDNSPF